MRCHLQKCSRRYRLCRRSVGWRNQEVGWRNQELALPLSGASGDTAVDLATKLRTVCNAANSNRTHVAKDVRLRNFVDDRRVLRPTHRRRSMYNLIKTVGAALFLTTTILSSASAADMVENFNHPRHVRTDHHAYYATARARHVAYDRGDCGQLYYEYRTRPPYTEIKTLCGPRPVVYDTGVIHGPAPQ